VEPTFRVVSSGLLVAVKSPDPEVDVGLKVKGQSVVVGYSDGSRNGSGAGSGISE